MVNIYFVSKGVDLMHSIFLSIAIILVATKLGGILSSKIKMPHVLGALLAGVIIGPSILGIVHENEYIKLLSDLGVVMLMFLAGLETDLKEFKKAGKTSLLIAIGGVILPLIFGMLSAYVFFNNFYENLFIGVILTATSVSISVETLNELGKLNTRAGMNILGAAVIDDVIGLLVVSFVLSLASSAKSSASVSVESTLINVSLKVLVFIAGSLLLIWLLPKFISKFNEKSGRNDLLVILAIAFALVCGFFAEELGIAAITGAYVAGLVLSSVTHKDYIEKKVHTISSNFLTPIFFASVGIAANVKSMNSTIFLLTLLLLATAILGKIVGCGGVAKLCGLTTEESIQIGAGMISRGEVALITTNLGLDAGIITPELFIPTLVVVIGTTLITPIFLKIAFTRRYYKRHEV